MSTLDLTRRFTAKAVASVILLVAMTGGLTYLLPKMHWYYGLAVGYVVAGVPWGWQFADWFQTKFFPFSIFTKPFLRLMDTCIFSLLVGFIILPISVMVQIIKFLTKKEPSVS